MSKISILVAVYNAEPWLRQCLDSLRAQTLTDIQIICVDDASTDGSAALLDEYARLDSRFTLLRQSENHGQAVARNRAIEVADGAFMTMVDADDWLAPDALEQAWRIVEQHPETDAVLLDLIKVFPNERYEPYWQEPGGGLFDSEGKLSGREAMEKSLEWGLHGLYIIRSDIQRTYPYDDTARLYSDDNTTRIHYLHSREVRYCSGRYFYRQHTGSCTGGVSPLYFESLAAQRHMHEMLLAEGIDNGTVRRYERYRWLQLVDNCYWLTLHHDDYTACERHEAKMKIRSAWHTFRRTDIPFCARSKFGYFRCLTFHGFWAQESLYFALRKRFGRL